MTPHREQYYYDMEHRFTGMTYTAFQWAKKKPEKLTLPRQLDSNVLEITGFYQASRMMCALTSTKRPCYWVRPHSKLEVVCQN